MDSEISLSFHPTGLPLEETAVVSSGGSLTSILDSEWTPNVTWRAAPFDRAVSPVCSAIEFEVVKTNSLGIQTIFKELVSYDGDSKPLWLTFEALQKCNDRAASDITTKEYSIFLGHALSRGSVMADPCLTDALLSWVRGLLLQRLCIKTEMERNNLRAINDIDNAVLYDGLLSAYSCGAVVTMVSALNKMMVVPCFQLIQKCADSVLTCMAQLIQATTTYYSPRNKEMCVHLQQSYIDMVREALAVASPTAKIQYEGMLEMNESQMCAVLDQRLGISILQPFMLIENLKNSI